MPNEILPKRLTATTFAPSGADNDWTLTSLAAGAGRQSEQVDLGANGGGLYELEVVTEFNTTPVVGESLRLYLKTYNDAGGDGANDDGTGDIAVSAEDKLLNLIPLGTILVDEAAQVPMVFRNDIWVPARYVSLVMWNDTADALSSTAGDHSASLTQKILEIQD